MKRISFIQKNRPFAEKERERSTPLSSQSWGFTLIEILIVLSIIAALAAVVIPRLGGQRNQEIRSTVRKLSTLTRNLHSRAKLFNVSYRLVIDMQDGPDSKEAHSYWVERTSQPVLIRSEENEKKKKKADDEAEDPDGFGLDPQLTRKPIPLPNGMIFSKVEITSKEGEITEGKAYLNFLAQGLADEAAIHIRHGGDLNWTIAIHPLTGHGEVIAKDVSLKDIQDQD